MRGNIDILMISKTKLDANFPTSQFCVNGYTSPYRLDRNNKGGGILSYVRKGIPSKLIKANFPNAEGFFSEINLTKKKWVISCSYNSHNETIFPHMESMGKAADSLSSKYENFLITVDFNAQASDSFVILFVLTLASGRAVLYGNVSFPILVLSTKKQYSSFCTLLIKFVS